MEMGGGQNITIDNRLLTANGWKSIAKDHENLDEKLKATTLGQLKLLASVPLTPMHTNRAIEQFRGGIPQTLNIGAGAVYKSGTEENGVRDESANNIGEENIPMKNGKLDVSKVGNPVEFNLSTIDGVIDFAKSTKEGGLMSQTCNYGLPGCNDMSLTHDPIATYLKNNHPEIPEWIRTQATIPPTYIINTYGLIGKPINILIDYIETPAHTVNPNPISLPIPELNFQKQ